MAALRVLGQLNVVMVVQRRPQPFARRLFIIHDQQHRFFSHAASVRHFVCPRSRCRQQPQLAAPARGSQTRKVVPWPTWLSTSMFPPWARTIRCTIINPRPVPFFLRCVKRVENPVDLLLRNAAAGVRDAHPDALGTCARLQRQHAAPRHRLHRVLDEVHQHLLDLRRVQAASGTRARQLLFQRQPAVLQFRPQQRQRLLAPRRSTTIPAELRRRRPDGLQKLRDDVIQPVDLALGHFQILLQFLRDLRGIARARRRRAPAVRAVRGSVAAGFSTS